MCRRAYPTRIHSYLLWAYFDKLTFLGGPICRKGGAFTDFYGSYTVQFYVMSESNCMLMYQCLSTFSIHTVTVLIKTDQKF